MRDAVAADGLWHYAPETVTLYNERQPHGLPSLLCGLYAEKAEGFGIWEHIPAEYRCPECASRIAMQMRHHDEWHGKYRAVTWEIVCWMLQNHETLRCYTPIWNYYLFLWQETVPDAWADLCVTQTPDKHYRHYDSNTVRELPLHGGCTFYQIGKDARGMDYVKVGCAYEDKYHTYMLDSVGADVRTCIDRLHEITRVVGPERVTDSG